MSKNLQRALHSAILSDESSSSRQWWNGRSVGPICVLKTAYRKTFEFSGDVQVGPKSLIDVPKEIWIHHRSNTVKNFHVKNKRIIDATSMSRPPSSHNSWKIVVAIDLNHAPCDTVFTPHHRSTFSARTKMRQCWLCKCTSSQSTTNALLTSCLPVGLAIATDWRSRGPAVVVRPTRRIPFYLHYQVVSASHDSLTSGYPENVQPKEDSDLELKRNWLVSECLHV